MSDKKRGTSKVFRVFLIVFAVLLVLFGVLCINMAKRSKQAKQLQTDSEFMSQIRDETVDSLSDDQFTDGLERILPVDATTLDEYTAMYKKVSGALEDKEVYYSISRIDYFGTCACLLEITGDMNKDELQAFVPESGFSRMYIHITPISSEGERYEYLWDGQELTETFSSEEEIDADIADRKISAMFDSLCTEYKLTDSAITFTNDVLRVTLKSVSDVDVVDIFDYLYRWCRQEEISTTIQVFNSSTLVALAQVDLTDTRFEEYFPAADLSAQYRLRFYIMNDYIKGTSLDSAKKLIIG